MSAATQVDLGGAGDVGDNVVAGLGEDLDAGRHGARADDPDLGDGPQRDARSPLGRGLGVLDDLRTEAAYA